MCRQSIQRGRRAIFPIYHYQNVELASLPSHARKSSITPRNPTQVIFTGSGKSPQTETPINVTNLESYITSLNPADQWVFQYLRGLDNLDHVVRSIQIGNCALISDGSFDENKHQAAAAAWCLGNEALHRQVKGEVLCAGQKKVHSAYRGELAGLYGGLKMVEAIYKIYDIQEGRIILGCDGQGAITRIQHDRISLSSSNFDYASAIRSVLSQLPLHIDYMHVKGHADKHTPLENLSVVEIMNIWADKMAKRCNSTIYDDALLANLPLKGEFGPIKLPNGQNQTKITSAFRKTMYESLTKISTNNYWMKKMKIPITCKDSIDWDIMGETFKSITKEKQKEVVKWNAEFCGTSKNLYRWKEQTHQKCPVCGFDGETTDHILCCPHPDAKREWHKTLGNLEEWMKQQSTDPNLIEAILENINAWRESRPPKLSANSAQKLTEAIEMQTKIGWSSFIRGFVYCDWKEIQRAHLQKIQSKKSHKRWLKMLIIKFWQISWDMWRFRNGILHTQSTTHITNFTFLLTTEIVKEMDYGGRLLPPTCKYLFNQSQSKLLSTTTNNKKLWLANVWAARDAYTPADVRTQTRNHIVQAHMVAWKKRLK